GMGDRKRIQPYVVRIARKVNQCFAVEHVRKHRVADFLLCRGRYSSDGVPYLLKCLARRFGKAPDIVVNAPPCGCCFAAYDLHSSRIACHPSRSCSVDCTDSASATVGAWVAPSSATNVVSAPRPSGIV